MDENELIQLSEEVSIFIMDAFMPANSITGCDEMKTTTELSQILLSNGIEVSTDTLFKVLNELDFKKQFISNDYFWLLIKK